METKLCTSCLTSLPLNEFYRHKDGRSRGATCRKCEHAYTAARRKTEKGKESERRIGRKYNASKAGKAKRKAYNASEARKLSSKKWTQSAKGKAAIKRANDSEAAKIRKTRYNKTEKFRTSLKRYQATEKGKASLARGVHKRRGLMAINSTLTADEWNAIKRQWKNRCAYCGQAKPLTMDHLLPITRGGHHVASNVVPACLPCNASKNNKLLREWRPEIADRFGQ